MTNIPSAPPPGTLSGDRSSPSSDTPISTVLAFDFGLRRIGVAIGNAMINSANPLTTIQHTDSGPDWNAIDRLMKEWQPSLVIVGLPSHVDGTLSKNAAQAQEFAEQLQLRTGHSVLMVDEKLSSAEAKEQIKAGRQAGTRGRTKSGDIDKIAAQVILRTWLNEH